MCCRTASTKPIFPKNKIKTAIPPNGVTARCVSRRINRSSDNRAVISRGTGLSVAFDSMPLLSQILTCKLTPNFGFRVKTGWGRKHHAAQGGRKDGGQRPLGKNVAKADEKARGRGGGACFARPCIEPEDPGHDAATSLDHPAGAGLARLRPHTGRRTVGQAA